MATCDAVLSETWFLLNRLPPSLEVLHRWIRRGWLVNRFDFETMGNRAFDLMARYRNLPMTYGNLWELKFEQKNLNQSKCHQRRFVEKVRFIQRFPSSQRCPYADACLVTIAEEGQFRASAQNAGRTLTHPARAVGESAPSRGGRFPRRAHPCGVTPCGGLDGRVRGRRPVFRHR